MVRASRRELEHAYRSHKALSACASHPVSRSHHLLLVYAIECGLKAAVMRRQRAEDTEQLGLLNYGHDLREFLKHLRAPAQLRVSDAHTGQSKSQTLQPKQIHEALRYGVGLRQEERVMTELKDVLAWLAGELT
jgi:hypothetical protein